MQVLQLDSVNVFARSHYLPVFARLGAYDPAALDELLFDTHVDYVEYWAHQAAVIPVSSWPLWGWAMEKERSGTGRTKTWAADNKPMIDFLLRTLAEQGPLPSRAFEHESNRRTGPWWGWSEVKTGLEVLFFRGEVAVAGRTRFERVYDLTERRLPAEMIECRVAKPDAILELVRRAAVCLGVGTLRDLADYWRLPLTETKVAVQDLVDAGDLLPVTVQGWGVAAYLHRDARAPRQIETAALLSPFDPMLWHRERTERMFGFHYRIEIYTPAPKRIFGYYSLPILLDESLVGRVDLKADRQARTLLVQSAWAEPSVTVDAARVAALLRDAAAWQRLERIEVVGRGDLSARLAGALGKGGSCPVGSQSSPHQEASAL